MEDTRKNNYRWATVEMAVDRVITKSELQTVMTIRDQFKQQLFEVEPEDYDDPGDKTSEDV